jgi:ferrous iron transport protein A
MTHSSGIFGKPVPRAVAGIAAAPNARAADIAGVNLADLTTGTVARVVAVLDDAGGAELARRLAELGFLPGEKLRIVARGMLGKEPIAVRIGTGTFALRRFEAALIRVAPERAP